LEKEKRQLGDSTNPEKRSEKEEANLGKTGGLGKGGRVGGENCRRSRYDRGKGHLAGGEMGENAHEGTIAKGLGYRPQSVLKRKDEKKTLAGGIGGEVDERTPLEKRGRKTEIKRKRKGPREKGRATEGPGTTLCARTGESRCFRREKGGELEKGGRMQASKTFSTGRRGTTGLGGGECGNQWDKMPPGTSTGEKENAGSPYLKNDWGFLSSRGKGDWEGKKKKDQKNDANGWGKNAQGGRVAQQRRTSLGEGHLETRD